MVTVEAHPGSIEYYRQCTNNLRLQSKITLFHIMAYIVASILTLFSFSSLFFLFRFPLFGLHDLDVERVGQDSRYAGELVQFCTQVISDMRLA